MGEENSKKGIVDHTTPTFYMSPYNCVWGIKCDHISDQYQFAGANENRGYSRVRVPFKGVTLPILSDREVNLMIGQQHPGFEMHDLLESGDFMMRPAKDGAATRQQLALHMITQKFSGAAEEMAQQLVDAAVEYCGADGAGISLEESDGKGGLQFRWIVAAGSFARYLHGTAPRNLSPCGVCLDRWRAQQYLISKPYYDFLGVVADPILDGMLIPWATDSMRGTIWAVSHTSKNAFDPADYYILSALADLVSVAIRFRINEC